MSERAWHILEPTIEGSSFKSKWERGVVTVLLFYSTFLIKTSHEYATLFSCCFRLIRIDLNERARDGIATDDDGCDRA